MIWAPVAELPEVAADPTIRGLGTFTEVMRDDGPPFETLSAPFRIRGADIAVRGPAPAPGQHTTAVLEEATFTAEEIADLAGSGVFG
jgi:crotonobetainyl-CoA:carnitine CoA-transferase CaiB-like acyl-CoA transferase